MKQISTILSVFAFTFLLFSCKKKDKAPEPSSSANQVNPPTGAYSNFQADYMFTDIGGILTKDSSVHVSFYTSPPSSSTSISYVNAGNVVFNGSTLNYSSNYYSNSSPVAVGGVINWSVSGSGTVTAFSHSYTASHPKYSGGNLLPDTCIKANGITINVSGVTNSAQGVSVLLSQGSSIYKSLLTPTGNITFTSSELAVFNVNNPITITVSIGNYKTEILGGVSHGFSNNLFYSKIAYLK